MSNPRRNDPCPCRSGKKYKRCCGAAGATPWMPGALDRERAFRELTEFVGESEYLSRLEEAQEVFWSDALEGLTPEQTQQARELPHVETGAQLYSMLDFEVVEGASFAELFLAARGSALESAQERVLETLAGSRLSVYEVREVRLHAGFFLRDLWRGGQVWVEERTATESILEGQVLVARVSRWPGKVRQLEGDTWVFPSDRGPELVDFLREEGRALLGPSPTFDGEEFLRKLGPLVNEFWLRRVALPSPPRR
jgi:hypothetical protein